LSTNEKPCGCAPSLKKSLTDESVECGCETGTEQKSANEVGCSYGGNEKKDTNSKTECGCTSDKSSDRGIKRGKLKVVTAPRIYRDRRPVKGEVVTVIDVNFDSSGIDLVDAWSRAIPRGEVHEIMIWNPLEEGDDAAAVAFIEVTQSGNIVNGDEVRLDGEAIGNLAGFDYNHMPNHMNLVVETGSLDLKVKLGSVLEFVPNPMLSLLVDDQCC
jgi:hypothetical protein